MAEYFVEFIRKSHPKLWKAIKKQQKRVKKQRRKSLRAKNADAARQTVEEEWIICAPQPSSLLKKMNQSSTESHVIKPVGSSNFVTYNNKSLKIFGNQVTCGKGFEEEGRVVNIVYTVNAADGKHNIALVYLKKPLEGGIDAPSCADDLTPQMVKLYLEMLACYPELEGVMNGLWKFRKQLKGVANDKQLHRVRPVLHKCIKERCRQCALIICQHMKERDEAFIGGSGKLANTETAASTMQSVPIMLQVCASFVMRSIHEAVFRWVCFKNEKRTEALRRVLTTHPEVVNMTLDDLDMPKHFQVPIDDGLAQLITLDDCTSPLDKAQCLLATSKKLEAAVERHIQTLGGKDYDFGTDNRLALLIYAIKQAAVVHGYYNVLANVAYLKQYVFLNQATCCLGFQISHFEVAVLYLLNKRLDQPDASTTTHTTTDTSAAAATAISSEGSATSSINVDHNASSTKIVASTEPSAAVAAADAPDGGVEKIVEADMSEQLDTNGIVDPEFVSEQKTCNT